MAQSSSVPQWMRRSAATALVVCMLVTLGCGGGSRRDLGGRTSFLTLSIDSTEDFDGLIRNDGFIDLSGGLPAVGDLDATREGLAVRVVYSFDLSELPAGAILQSATLRVWFVDTQGVPFSVLGALVVDHVDLGPTIDTADFAGGTLDSNIGALGTAPQLGYRNLGVAAQVQQDLAAGRRRSDFRLRFAVDSNLDRISDLVAVNDGEDSRRIQTPTTLELVYLLEAQ